MKLKLKLPFWLTDPERFWQRLSTGLGILVLDLFLICCWQQMEKTKFQSNMRELSKLNDTQRKVIGQIGEGLGQVMDKLDKIEQEQKKPQQVIVTATAEPAQAPNAAEQLPLTEAGIPAGDYLAAAPAEDLPKPKTLVADLNGDGVVDWADFDLFSRDWEKTGTLAGDFNHDNMVDWQDFQIFTDQWMKTESWYAGRDNFTDERQYANVQPMR